VKDPALAAAFALMAAVGSATFSIIIRKGQRHGNAMTGVLIGLIVSVPILSAATALLWEPGWWHPSAIGFFVAAGLAGPCIGRMLIFLGIHHLGVARAIPLKSVQPLVAAALAYAILGERPGPYIWAGTFLIVAGCAAFSIKKKGDSAWNRRLIWLPLVAVVAFASGAILRKIGLGMLHTPLLGVTFTSISGLVFILGFSLVMPPGYRPDLRWGKAWFFYGVCGLINTATFIISFHAIMRGDITIVTPISSTSPFFALVLSHLFLKDVERVTRLIVAGTALTVAGGAIIGWRVM
jgi:drug/metabolite transporter (DMT)-like permease